MQLISAVLHNIISLAVLLLAASHFTLSVPKRRSQLIWGIVWGIAVVLASLKPVVLQSGVTMNFCCTIMLMAGFLGGALTSTVALAVLIAFLVFTGTSSLTTLGSVLLFTALGLVAGRLHETVLSKYKVLSVLALGLSLIAATTGVMLPSPGQRTWYMELQGWLIIVLVYAGSYITLHIYLALRATMWRRALHESFLRTGSTRLLVFSKLGRLVLSSRPVREEHQLITHVREILCDGHKPLVEEILTKGVGHSTTVIVEQANLKVLYHASFSRMLLPNGDVAIKAVLEELSDSVQSLDQLEKFFSMSVDGMAIVDTSGYIRVANPALAYILGYSKQELQSLNVLDLIHPNNLAELESVFLVMLTVGSPQNAMVGTFLAKDGTYRTLSWSASPALTEGLVYVAARDVTEHKKYELAMAQLASIVEQAEYAIISLSTSGRVLTWNNTAQTMWGYRQADVYGVEIAELIEQGQQHHLETILTEVVTKGLAHRIELRYRQRSGSIADLIATVSPLRSPDGGVAGLSVICRDYTREKALEQELARLGRLDLAGQMAASIGHEIRNPMTTIRGFLQLFQNKPDLCNYRSQFGLIISELDCCNFIITEFLALAKNRVVSFNREQLNNIISALKPLIQADTLMGDLILNIELDSIPEINIDAKEIRQLILNLVRNSIEAMAKTGGVLTISTRVDGEHVLLEVMDQGTGIPHAVAEQIGTPFFTTKDSGTGLGLAVCYSIANNHHAKLNFVSSPMGTTFTVRFPVA